jgi:NADH-quinone oxidoreductase subunit H
MVKEEGNAFLHLLEALVPSGVPIWAVVSSSALLAVGVCVALISVNTMFCVWMERKVAGHIQCRYGPMYVGWHGWLQSIADGIKLLVKEDIVPRGSDHILFVLAPAIALAGILGAMAAYPFSPHVFFADIDLGLFLILALSSVTTIGIVMAGWASNSKWALLGAMREAAQVIAYEVPLGLALLVPVMIGGTLNLIEASRLQSDWYGMGWFVFKNPFGLPALLLFLTAALAETKRAPFDLPEADSELVAGFHTEYSGIRWSFFFMEEYTAMFLMSALAALFFLGGFESPLTWGLRQSLGEDPGFLNHVVLADGSTKTVIAFGGLLFQVVCALTLIAKTLAGVFLMMWLRWTLPRLRVDQVMSMGYKYLTPLALACVLGGGVWEWARARIWS